jgi:hypothetical protein
MALPGAVWLQVGRVACPVQVAWADRAGLAFRAALRGRVVYVFWGRPKLVLRLKVVVDQTHLLSERGLEAAHAKFCCGEQLIAAFCQLHALLEKIGCLSQRKLAGLKLTNALFKLLECAFE